MKCERCGTELKAGDKVCLGCGFEVGKEYIPEANETLESLMELPEEEVIDDAEEMEIEGSKKELDLIDGEKVEVDNLIVGENVGKVKVKKKFNFFWIIILLLIILSVFVYFNFDRIKCFYFSCETEDVPVKPNDDKININNHPTKTYLYDNRFSFRLNDLWKEKNGVYVNGLSEFKFLKYEWEVNTIDNYLKYIGISETEERVVNNINYYYVINGNSYEYVIVLKEKIYVLSFVNVSLEETESILNTVKFYK